MTPSSRIWSFCMLTAAKALRFPNITRYTHPNHKGAMLRHVDVVTGVVVVTAVAVAVVMVVVVMAELLLGAVG